jgi:tight adherence protein B
MEGMFPILIALAVAVAAFAVWQVFQSVFNNEKRRLSQRLSSEGRFTETAAGAVKSITVNNDAEGMSAVLTKISVFEGLHRSLLHAWPGATVSRFLFICGALAVTLYLIAFLTTASVIVGVVGGALGAYIPFIILSGKKNKRQQALAMQLPEALDFLARILKAGHSLSTGLQMMSEELPKPLAQEFRRAYDQHSLGVSLDEALKDMATRIESTDFAFFVTAVLIQRQTGGDLTEVLTNISSMVRQRIRLANHVRAKTAEGRFTGYILTAFPGVMFVLVSMLNPEYAAVMWKTDTGLFMLGGAFGLTILGLVFIKKLTTVRV